MCTASNTAQSRSRATNVSFFTTPEPHTCERGRERRLVLPPKSAQARAHFLSGHAPHTQNTCICEVYVNTLVTHDTQRGQTGRPTQAKKAQKPDPRARGALVVMSGTGRGRGALGQKCSPARKAKPLHKVARWREKSQSKSHTPTSRAGHREQGEIKGVSHV
jgi:hypothetical protein